MITAGDDTINHERFKELGALANTGALTPEEWAELKGHLQICTPCVEVYAQYESLVREGIPLLSARYPHRLESGSWDEKATRERLFSRIRAEAPPASIEPPSRPSVKMPRGFVWTLLQSQPARLTLAACLVMAVALGTYRMGARTKEQARQAQASAEGRYQKLMAEKNAASELVAVQAAKQTQLTEQVSRGELELIKLRAALRALEDRENELTALKTASEEHSHELETASRATQDQLRDVSQQRDALSGQLRDAEKTYLGAQAELASLRSQRDKSVRQTASLESRLEELSNVNLDLGRRLQNDEQYLASDRDIRELMGARKLYIADVFDVDGHSRTRKPYGRVFYTHGKSLIFYAFDLDQQPGVKNASAFQAWGVAESGESKPLNLGILYMDNEANRRWMLRCDDPKQLADIDAVFVTVEPHGGSQKPSGKPFLYALLRKESNHP